jgi:hypothetical protein
MTHGYANAMPVKAYENGSPLSEEKSESHR